MNLILWMILLAGMVWVYGELWIKATTGKIRWTIEISEEPIMEGDEVQLWTSLENHSWLPIFWIHLIQPLPEGVGIRLEKEVGTRIVSRTFLLPRQRVKRPYTLICETRGEKRWDRATLEIGDGMGLKKRQEILDPDISIRVRPEPLEKVELQLKLDSLLGEQTVQRWFHEDPSRLAGIRPYMSGDSYKQVHWAATARRGELMVKQFEPSSEAHFYVILNHQFYQLYLLRASKTIIDHQCRLAARLFTYAAEQGFSFGLFTNASWAGLGSMTVPARQSSDQLDVVMEALSRLLYLPDGPLVDLLGRLRQGVKYGSTLVLITAYVNQEIALAVDQLRAEGHNILIFISDPQVETKLLPPFIPVIPAYVTATTKEGEEGLA